ncbi:MAG TPA: PAS domain S-box protein [Bacteroidota bacterium]|nr:PAS domain S-box protein [Bacteroidota bacterium]
MDALLKTTGYDREEMIGMNAIDFGIWPNMEERQKVMKVLAEGTSNSARIKGKNKAGEMFDALIASKEISVNNEPHYLTVVHDITKLERTVLALQESEEQFKVMFESAAIGVALVSLEGKPIHSNPALTRILGYSDAEICQMAFTEFTHPDDVEKDMSLYRSLISGEIGSYQIEKRYFHKDGTIIWGLLTVSLIKSQNGTPRFTVGMVEDITIRKQAHERIMESELRYRELVETARDAIFTVSNDGKFTSINNAFESITGWKKEEWLGRPFMEGVHPNDLSTVSERFARLMAGELNQLVEIRVKTKIGEYVWVEMSVVPQVRQETIVGALGIARDVTERKMLEEKLLRAQRLESLGTLAGGIAHDLNNILGPILLSLEILRKSYGVDNGGVLNVIEKTTKRGAEIVKQILSFARGMGGERMVLQLRTLINDVGNVLKETFPRMIQIDLSVPKDLWPVVADPTQIDQVIMNLCVNARDAMATGGQLRIRAENVMIDEVYVHQNPEAKKGEYVCITVADTGAGIPSELMKKIFDPFFTTKEIGKGTGLGLATVLGIIKNHGGLVEVRSEIARGTEFKIYIPAAESGVDETVVSKENVMPRYGKGEKVLFVDDEAAFREIGKTAIESYGYKVLIAENGIHAISLFHEHRNEIDILLTDMLMPYMGGLEMIEAIRRVMPEMKVIAMSGSSGEIELSKLNRMKGIMVLNKPFTCGQLLVALDEMLHGRT